jgi:hypothetical protein
MSDDDTIDAARTHGFVLVYGELTSGESIWGWRFRGDAHWPGFLTRREALDYMVGWLEMRCSEPGSWIALDSETPAAL